MRQISRPPFSALRGAVAAECAAHLAGHVAAVSALSVDITGLANQLAVGDRIILQGRNGAVLPAEIIASRGNRLQAAPFGATLGIGAGAPVLAPAGRPDLRGALAPCAAWLGRVIDPLGAPLDGRGALPPGQAVWPVRADPPAATLRARLGPPIDLGVRVLNCFATCRTGQRLGLFAGSGVGKSTLLSMLARYTACDVAVLALVGERGREVRDFLEDDLGAEGLARAVVIVATSDAPPLMRREAAYAALTVAEYFRDQGKSVLLLMDSVTRFCLALRELGLAAGEPPATRGYPPSVFAELPRLLERAGPGLERPDGTAGQITALFTVLVEGGDHDEPVADAVRGILDGHIVLDRRIGEGGRYPAVDVLKSLSRAASGILTPERAALVRTSRRLLALYEDMADMVRLGAYKQGSDPAVDEAVRLVPRLEEFLRQARDDPTSLDDSFARLAQVLT
ncbi:MAG TPA: flagellar protein export ATPase FliI [Acetobacteraceae bacterium]|nr:flagellar protein export ATPase FliI [Acetobacteraceae bacterium]